MKSKTILKIVFIFLFLSALSFLNIYLNLSESFEMPEIPFINDTANAFCQSKTGANLEKSCNKLTQGNCGRMSCCVWTSDNKCKSGNVNGPTFNTGPNGKTLPLDYYYFQGKCYGSNCPNTVTSF
jgi:hypothetical protein